MTAAAEPLTTKELLLRWDADRPRSKQRQIGWSELGVCRRRAGYIVAGTEPTNYSGSIQAVMGTAIHMVQEEALRRYVPAASTEEEVTFAGILGHLDRYENGDVIDTKTTTSRYLRKVRDDGPSKSNLWQINGYAAAVIQSGRRVRRVILDYIARDTGEEYRWIGAPDPQAVRDALTWLKEVRETELDWLPREFEPDSMFCRGCAFLELCWPEGEPHRDARAVLYLEQPDAARWASQLEQARKNKAAATRLEEEAKGALDALRPNTSGTATVDVGYPKHLRWTVKTTERLDNDQVRADYQAAGAPTPVKPSTSVTLSLVKPKTGAA